MRLSNPWKITLAYALFSLVWILGSDRLFLSLFPMAEELTRWQTGKGLVFVLLSSGFIHLLASFLERAQRRAAEALAASEKRFRALVENGRELVYVVDAQGKLLYASPNVAQVLGYDPLGYTRERLSALDFVHPEDRLYAEAVLEDLLRHPGATREYTFRILDAAGQVRHARVWGRNLLEDPAVGGIVLNVRDESELEEERARLQGLLEALPGRVYQAFVPEGADPAFLPLRYASPQAQRILGYPPEELQENPQAFYARVHPEDRAQTQEVCRRAVARPGEVQSVTYRFWHGKKQAWVWLQDSLVYDPLSRLLTGYGSDVTELKEAEARFRLLFQAHPLPMWVYDRETYRFLEVNEAAVAKYGYAREEFLTMTILEIRPERERLRLLENLRRPRPSLERSGPWTHRLKDGREIQVEIHSHTLEYAGRPAVLVAALDITEKLQAEATRRLLQEALEAAHEAVVLTDRDGRIEWVNPAFTRLTGYALEEALGQNPRILKSGVHPREFYQEMWATILAGRVWNGELVNRRKDGTLYAERMTITPVRIGGEIRHFIAIKRDVTEERAKEQALRESEALFRTLAETAPALILLWQGERLTFANQEALRITGYTLEELQSRPVWEFVHPADREMVRARGQARIRGENPPGRYTFRIQTRAGEVRWLDYSAARVAVGGEPAVLGVALDITEAKERELSLEAFARLSLALRQSEELKGMMEHALEAILGSMEAPVGSILLYDQDTGRLEEAASRGWLQGIPTPQTLTEGSMVARAFQGEVVVSPDLKADPRVREGARPLVPEGWSGTVVPILAGREPIGALTLAWPHPRVPTPAEVERAQFLAEALGNAVRRASLRRKLAKRVEHLEALRLVDQAILASLDFGPSLEILLDQVVRTPVDAVALFLYKPQEKVLYLHAHRGFLSPKGSLPARIPLGQGHVGRAALLGEKVAVDDLRQNPGANPSFTLEEGLQAERAYPLFAKGRLLGVLALFTRRPWDLSPEDEEFLEALAGQGAVALDNARTFQELLKSQRELEAAYDLTLWGWAKAVELRDQETAGHTERVTELTLRLARALGVPEEDLDDLRRGAILHDVGKIGIPDAILRKPGPLTEEEWALMKKHPVYAYEWLSGIPFLKKALEIPYGHHERWDGSGYPRGLKGWEIPLAARIFAVVDVYDALTSDRPYRQAWPKEKALAYLQEQAGKQFDPEVVQAFLRLMALESDSPPHGAK
ncbi:HD-hydrolase domain protein [Thermus sp. CCB_US3_UF1]|uniref:PAS domain S-box protein n=3 Tax=unclassified Thermus TaxID=2619321 RepID=UPI0002389315|nr:PAS domain S-box protein [Thermus sp. CCB_US3_UF1]AEV16610.1 HD-hydrolase domain protein [Thermus sp. CCB_US3_UF1]